MPIFVFGGKKILFIHIPKTGGSSIEKSLSLVSDDCTFYGSQNSLNEKCPAQHYQLDVLSKYIDLHDIDYTFAIARNPIARFVSEINYRLEGDGILRLCLKAVFRKRYLKPIFEPGLVFILLIVAFFRPYAFSNHFRSQRDFISHPRVRVYIYEEGLEEVYTELQELIGRRLQKFYEKKGVRTVERLTPISAGMVYLFYRADFQALGLARA